MRFADFFSGIGGFRVGLESIGWECVFSNEINYDSNLIYKTNFSLDKLFEGSIADLSVDEIPDFDVFCGGFPCQPFSIAGKRCGENDERGNLFEHVIRICSKKKPRVIFLENVKNLYSIDNGNIFRKYIHSLNEIGYEVHHDMVDSARFKVPQSRNRLFIVAFRRDLNVNNFTFPKGSNVTVPVKSIINHNDNSIPLGNRWKYYVDYYSDRINEKDLPFKVPKTRKALERRDNEVDLDNCIYQLRSSGVRAISVNRPFPTLAVSISGGGAMIPIYSKEKRHLSVLEMQRIMGFPDKFHFPTSRTSAIKGLANAVCPPVIAAIGEEINLAC
jgi:DNA (cytosine-5)-methyltransferase 1